VGGGANTSAYIGIATSGGVILGAQVAGGTNTSTCGGITMPRGVILGAEVEEGTNMPHHAMYGVAATVVAPCAVTWVPLLHCMQ
jgi:hypothetical protein